MRKVIMAAALTMALAACDRDANTAENLDAANATLDNMAMEDPSLNAAMNGDMGMANNMATGNMSVANVQNAMETDLRTNDPDTNLANGM